MAEIQFLSGIKEISLPLVKLTKSRNGKTGTATFLFIQPRIFEQISFSFSYVEKMALIWENKSITTNDLKVFFREGNPFLMKAIFVFKNSREWFDFLKFMSAYSQETGLSFLEQNTSF